MKTHVILKLITALGTVMLIVMLQGCEKYLDKKILNNIALITTLDDVEALLNNTRYLNFNNPCQDEAGSDDIYIPDAVYNTITKLSSRDIYIWKKTEHEQASSPWGKIYETVFYTNVSLSALDEIPIHAGNTDRWHTARSSALVFRANAFLRAAWIWAKAYDEQTASSDLGIVLKLNPDVNEVSVRASVKETYEKIIYDLKSAVPHLPFKSSMAVTPSKAVAYGLLSRTYFSMRDYHQAELYADSCLAIQRDLLDFNQEITIPTATSSTNPFNMFNKEVIFSTVITSYYFAVSTTYAVADTTLVKMYEAEDLRRRVFFRNTANGAAMRGNYSRSGSQFFTGITTAEMLLNKAECLVRRNKIAGGLQLIDQLWQKRYSTGKAPVMDYEIEQAVALQMVLKERRKELVMRSLRWIDIKRLNKEGANIILRRVISGQTYTLNPNDDRYASPIPSDVVRLSGIQQN